MPNKPLDLTTVALGTRSQVNAIVLSRECRDAADGDPEADCRTGDTVSVDGASVSPADVSLPFSTSVVTPMQVSSIRESAVGATEAGRTSRGAGVNGDRVAGIVGEGEFGRSFPARRGAAGVPL